MENLLKSKGFWQYTKVIVPDQMDNQDKFVINENKKEVVGVIMAYISREIHFHTSGIKCPHVVWSKMKSLFNNV